MPPTFPVTGKVIFSGGGAISEGTVLFTPTFADADFYAVGIIENGSFSMATSRGQTKVNGVPAGSYKVDVRLAPVAGERPILIKILSDTLTVAEKENQFTIEVEKIVENPE